MSWEPLHSSSCSHFVFSHTLRPGSRFYPLIFCEASLSLYSFSTVLTGSVAIVSLNVDPVLYTSYPFILPLWIAQTHILVIRNHMFPESFLLNGSLTAECVFATDPFSDVTDMGISRRIPTARCPRGGSNLLWSIGLSSRLDLQACWLSRLSRMISSASGTNIYMPLYVYGH